MGSDTGGYVRLRLETGLSTYDGKTNLLHRISELGFERAPSPAGRPIPDMKNIKMPPGVSPAPAGPGRPGATVSPSPLSVTSPKPTRTPAGKVALGGLDPNDVSAFALLARMDDDTFAPMNTVADSTITQEAEGVFGGKWAGFAVLAAPSGSRFRLVADISFKPSWKPKAKRPFQVVPVVMAFGTDLFKDHYLLALIVAQQTEERVDTSVTQPYQ